MVYSLSVYSHVPMNQQRSKSVKQQRAEAKVVYDRFVKLKGEFFKEEMLPMTEEDFKLIEKKVRFTNRITVPFFVMISFGALGYGLYLAVMQDWIYAGGMLLGGIGLWFFSRYLLHYYRELLELKKKVVITGIITNKEKYNRQYETLYCLMLSEEKEVIVEEKEYKQFHLGDIVQYESLSLERYISHAITLIDKISEVMQRDDIARSAEHDKV